ncbi:sulfate permease [Ascoidea rubescens DSM 1968]|uniref:Sulfate permease n=1 Tax=Ascoidea rubescens DSM 1968 TaxID=1344418 RepID=A0A1D2VEQ9_9ASCO|nr:sulfate permease [Ascoidea rubescens DSM 1968]ODV60105.1 sulfate permease [Ascoidea rubescens DSM 1968]
MSKVDEVQEVSAGKPSEAGEGHNLNVLEYSESPITIPDWFHNLSSGRSFGTAVKDYLISLFPISRWILHYNSTWLYSDLIAGITVGSVIVPQSMSYAQLAGLTPEYGLYSSFVGVMIYCFFATSKDVSIGPVAVMSLQIGKVISRLQDHHPNNLIYSEHPEIVATTFSLITGIICAALGLLRVGFVLEFINTSSILSFMTASAINIVSGQCAGLLGYSSKVSNKDSTYMLIIKTLKHLGLTNINAAFGLVSLFILYFWKYSCAYLSKRYPKKERTFFYIQTLRNAVVIIFATLFAWAVNRTHPGSELKLLGEVPSGLKGVGKFKFYPDVVADMGADIPVSTIILLLEHISIAKSFGRVNNYKINPDQEIIAIGINNLIGTAFMAYPATGSFSRSALKNRCGVRTPLAGVFTGIVVLLALYCLTEAFYFIPKAGLSAIIIHAVADLVSSYKVPVFLWKSNPLDCFIFITGVLISIFTSIENGIYFTICCSLAFLLFKIAKPNGVFLGRIKYAQVINPKIFSEEKENVLIENESSNHSLNLDKKSSTIKSNDVHFYNTEITKSFDSSDVQFVTRWVPLNKRDINKEIEVLPPPQGVLVFRPSEAFTYPNCSAQLDLLLAEAKEKTRPGISLKYAKAADRPWNDPGPFNWVERKKAFVDLVTLKKFKKNDATSGASEVLEEDNDPRPLLKAICFDFNSVTSIDSTGLQSLIDLKKFLEIYTNHNEVEFHFANILSPWIKRALVAGGFGIDKFQYNSEENKANVDAENRSSVPERGDEILYFNVTNQIKQLDQEATLAHLPVTATNFPFFHLDIPSFDEYE